jgi:hypothetical protein
LADHHLGAQGRCRLFNLVARPGCLGRFALGFLARGDQRGIGEPPFQQAPHTVAIARQRGWLGPGSRSNFAHEQSLGLSLRVLFSLNKMKKTLRLGEAE